MQKVPLSRDRDNVNPAYLRKIRVGVLNAKFEELNDDEAAGAAWVRDAFSSPKSSDDAVRHVMTTRFGDKHVTRDVNDIGSVKEAVSQGFNVIEGGSMTDGEWARVKAIKDEKGESVLKTSGQVAPTNVSGPIPVNEIIPRADWTPAMRGYATLVEAIGPKLINKPVAVQYINNEDVRLEGCFHKGFRGNKSKKGFTRQWGVMTVNLAYVNPESTFEQYSLLLHELAHDKVCSNDHLHHEFYDTVNDLGAQLAVLIQDEPELFDIGTPSCGFTHVQPLWNAAACPVLYSPELYSEGVAAPHAASA